MTIFPLPIFPIPLGGLHFSLGLVAASLFRILMVAAAIYETAINVADSRLDTWLAIVKWTGPVLGVTTIVLIYWEVLNMILKWLYKNQARKEARQELNREWVDWNRRRESALAEGREFNEPTPAENQRQGTNGR